MKRGHSDTETLIQQEHHVYMETGGHSPAKESGSEQTFSHRPQKELSLLTPRYQTFQPPYM